MPRCRESIAWRFESVSFSENIVWLYLSGLGAAASRNWPARNTGVPSRYMRLRGRAELSTTGPLPKAPPILPETATVPERPFNPGTLLLVVQRQVPTSSVKMRTFQTLPRAPPAPLPSKKPGTEYWRPEGAVTEAVKLKAKGF